MNRLSPDPKAGTVLPPPGSEACGCCEGVEVSTPQAHDNRQGLGAVDYRIGTYAQFRESLIDGLSESEHGPLGRLRTRDRDDFTIGLLDAFACAADVLSFYQERIANESWLRTATERTSLQEMGKLVGYRLRPGVAAETWLAFALEPPRQPPPNAPKDPGSFVTGIPTEVTLKVGLKVQSVPGPEEKPQTFETVEEIQARPEWNAMRPWLAKARVPGKGDRFAWLKGVRTGLKAGDALLFVGAEFDANTSSNRWDFRLLTQVVPEPDHDRTFVAWRRGLGSQNPAMDPASSDVRVYALRQRASVFGHNAPMWRTMPADYRGSYFTGGGGTEWPSFVVSPAGASYVDLDAAYPAIAPGSYVVLARGQYDYPPGPAPSDTYVELYQAAGVSEVSRDQFALSGKATRLKLKGDSYDTFKSDVRGTKVFAQSEELELAEYPVEDLVANAEVPVAVSAAGLTIGRRVIVSGRDTRGSSVVHQATLLGPAREQGAHALLDIKPPLPAPLVRASVVVVANVALARHGETYTEILGSGDASRPHQRFELKQLPLTFRAAPTAIGAASELSLRVGGVEWKERSTLYGSAPEDRVFTLLTDEAGREWVKFGDGIRGARLPSGSNNLRVTYRKGIGAEGNTRAESLTQLMTRPLGVKSVANLLPASGGTDPEAADSARETMPFGTRTLERAVSLLDYEDYARAYSGVEKAQAALLRLKHGPVIGITVAGQKGAALTESNPIWLNLLDALRSNGDPRVAFRLLSYQASTFQIGLKVKCHPDHESATVLSAVETKLREAFSFQKRALGQPVQQSEVIAVASAVPGVIAVDLDLLYGGSAPTAQTVVGSNTRLLASRMRVVGDVVMAAELLTLSSGPLARLEVMS